MESLTAKGETVSPEAGASDGLGGRDPKYPRMGGTGGFIHGPYCMGCCGPFASPGARP